MVNVAPLSGWEFTSILPPRASTWFFTRNSPIPLPSTVLLNLLYNLKISCLIRTKMDVNRVNHRDTQSYFGILVDDNNRKPVCRLYLENTRKAIGLFDENKKEIRVPINGLDDIYLHADQLINTALSYDNKPAWPNPKQASGSPLLYWGEPWQEMCLGWKPLSLKLRFTFSFRHGYRITLKAPLRSYEELYLCPPKAV